MKVKVKLIRYELVQTKNRKQAVTVAAETMPEGDADPPVQTACASLHPGKDTGLQAEAELGNPLSRHQRAEAQGTHRMPRKLTGTKLQPPLLSGPNPEALVQLLCLLWLRAQLQAWFCLAWKLGKRDGV